MQGIFLGKKKKKLLRVGRPALRGRVSIFIRVCVCASDRRRSTIHPF